MLEIRKAILSKKNFVGVTFMDLSKARSTLDLDLLIAEL